MARIEDSVDVSAPIDLVFAAVTDPRRSIEWSPSIIDVSDISVHPIAVGATWRQTARTAGQTARFTCTVEGLRPPHEGVLHVEGDYDARITTRCAPLDVGTRVSQVIEFEAEPGLKGSLAAVIMQAILSRELSQSLTRMRATMEGEAGGQDGSRTS